MSHFPIEIQLFLQCVLPGTVLFIVAMFYWNWFAADSRKKNGLEERQR